MRYYFTGANLTFVRKVREAIQMQEKQDEVVLLPNEYIEDFVLIYYNPETKKLERIEDFMEHSF